MNDKIESVFEVYIIVFAIVFVVIVASFTFVARVTLKIITTVTLALIAFSVIVAIRSFITHYIANVDSTTTFFSVFFTIPFVCACGTFNVFEVPPRSTENMERFGVFVGPVTLLTLEEETAESILGGTKLELVMIILRDTSIYYYCREGEKGLLVNASSRRAGVRGSM